MADPKTAALQKLMSDAELRQKFIQQPREVLQSLGLNPDELTPQEWEDLEIDPQSLTLEERQSKSAWFGGNPFG
jgi:hypothetical protein